jgi:hypothetical protein
MAWHVAERHLMEQFRWGCTSLHYAPPWAAPPALTVGRQKQALHGMHCCTPVEQACPPTPALYSKDRCWAVQRSRWTVLF